MCRTADAEENLLSTDRKVLYSYGREKAFGEEAFPLRILLMGIFLFDIYVEHTILPVNRSQLEIF
jgi:hypothetical protein